MYKIVIALVVIGLLVLASIAGIAMKDDNVEFDEDYEAKKNACIEIGYVDGDDLGAVECLKKLNH